MPQAVFKYATGQTVPDGAVYLKTLNQLRTRGAGNHWDKCWLVWHYFLVEVDANGRAA